MAKETVMVADRLEHAVPVRGRRRRPRASARDGAHAVSPRLRIVLIACAVAAYSGAPQLVRPLVQVLANPAACAQRAQVIAQAVIRVGSLTHILRRT
jgi:hypothetical protein